MNAMVFAAGLGTRLRPLTDTMPKALVPIDDTPMLQRVLLKLRNVGVTRTVVNVHHHPDMIIDFLHQHQNFGMDIIISDERNTLLDTGGGLLAALPLFNPGQPILLHNADILTDFPLEEMVYAHNQSKADATLLVSERNSSRRILFDSSNKMYGWKNMVSGQILPDSLDTTPLHPLSFGGVHIISPTLFPALNSYGLTNHVFSIMPFYIQACQDYNIIGHQPTQPFRWFDIGRPESLSEANESFHS